MKEFPKEGSLYDVVAKEVDDILKLMDPKAATEGLNSNMFGRMFVSIADTFRGLLVSFGNNIVNINKTIKRSELHEFIDSNHLKVSTVDRIPYASLVGFKIDIPANLQGTYKSAIQNLAQLYVRLNAMNNAKLMQTSLTNIFTSLTNGDRKTQGLINAAASVVNYTVRAAKPAVQECQQNFSGKFQQKVNFESVFLTKDEWVQCAKDLLELEPRLREAKTIHELITSMEGTLKGTCEFMNDNPNTLTPRDLQVFGEMVKNVALVMDGYNLAVTRHLALEHNYVLMVNAIYTGVK